MVARCKHGMIEGPESRERDKMRTCANPTCNQPLSKRAPKTARYCARHECQFLRQHEARMSRITMHYCRSCGDPVGYGSRRWCNKPECQEAQRQFRAVRRRELQAMDQTGEHRPKRSWGRKRGASEATGRWCQKCGKEIIRLRDARTGLVTFDAYFHCAACAGVWPKEDEVINEECIYA